MWGGAGGSPEQRGPIKRGGDCLLLLLSIYNPAVKNISAVRAQHPSAQTNSMRPCCHDNPRPRIWTQTMPPETSGAGATGCVLHHFLLLFFDSFLNKHHRKLPHTLKATRWTLCSPLCSPRLDKPDNSK